MGLGWRGRLAEVHPFVGDRIRFILDYAERFGPQFTVTSVVRTAGQQNALFEADPNTAVRAGCSQHQYGLAADVKFNSNSWQNWYLQSARNFGLTTVPGDPVHVQGFPGSAFREWSSGQGLCPDPSFPLTPPIQSFIHPDGRVVVLPSGARTWQWWA